MAKVSQSTDGLVMLVIVLCFYAAMAATIGAIVVRIGLVFVRKPTLFRSLSAMLLLQVLLGVAYMLFINFDAPPNAKIDWPIALICGVVGGLLSIVPAIPILRFRR